MGVTVTTKATDCTHLLAAGIVRTEKFLCAIANGAHILKKEWATESAKAGKILREWVPPPSPHAPLREMLHSRVQLSIKRPREQARCRCTAEPRTREEDQAFHRQDVLRFGEIDCERHSSHEECCRRWRWSGTPTACCRISASKLLSCHS